jgi:hypothetical protein
MRKLKHAALRAFKWLAHMLKEASITCSEMELN